MCDPKDMPPAGRAFYRLVKVLGTLIFLAVVLQPVALQYLT